MDDSDDPIVRIRRRRILQASGTLLALALIGGLAFVLGTIWQRERGPDSSVIFTKMSKQQREGVAFALSVKVDVEGDTNPLGQAGFTGFSSSEFKARGSYSPGAIRMLGESRSGQRQEQFEVRFTDGALYMGAGGQWYRISSPPAAVEESAKVLSLKEAKSAAKFFSPRSYEGPTIGGIDTWKILGEPPDLEGASIPVFNWDKIRNAISYELYTGREDNLPRKFHFKVSGDPYSWLLVPIDRGPDAEPAMITAELNLTLKDWGRQAPVEAPESYKELDPRQLSKKIPGLAGTSLP